MIGRFWSICGWIPSSERACPAGDKGSLAFYNWYVYEFWRFVFVQKEIAKAAESMVEFPPMQKGASFNLEELKQKLMEKISRQAQ